MRELTALPRLLAGFEERVRAGKPGREGKKEEGEKSNGERGGRKTEGRGLTCRQS